MRRWLFGLLTGLVAGPVLLHASQLAPLTSFTNGAVADASAVNANFAAVRTAANETDGRVTALEQAPAWTPVTFQNGWVNYDTVFQNAAFSKDPWGRVSLKGLIKNGTTGTTVCLFTLPAGYRPPRRTLHMVQSNNTVGRIDIEPTGCVLAYAVSAGWVSLDDVSFSVN